MLGSEFFLLSKANHGTTVVVSVAVLIGSVARLLYLRFGSRVWPSLRRPDMQVALPLFLVAFSVCGLVLAIRG